MAVFKCKMCGGELNIQDGVSVVTCEYCGTKQTVSKSRDEIFTNLYNRANNLRLKCEFDKAEQVYEKLLDIENTESEAHWGIVLCKYGVEYIEDPKTYKRIPTCHRTVYEAVRTDVNYIAAIENADKEQKALYVAEASVIDELQKNILKIVNNEEPFDVFICYKEADQNGKRTIDSSIANDIYYQLIEEGFKVFYAPITLEDKLGQEYEPYIFAALNTAKVMLVVGTKPEYFDSVWVRNEWSRFLKSMKNDRSKLLIPCYRDMDAYELPDEFAHLQAQDMSKIGFINDVIRGLKKVFDNYEELQKPAEKNKKKKSKKGNKNKGFWAKLKNKIKCHHNLSFRLPKVTTGFLVCTIIFYLYYLVKLGVNVRNFDEILLLSSFGLSFIGPLLIVIRKVKRKTTAVILQIISMLPAIIYFSDGSLYAIKYGVFSLLILISVLRIIWFVLVCLTKRVPKETKRKKNIQKSIIGIQISVIVTIILVIVFEVFGLSFLDYQLAKGFYKIGFNEYAYEYFVALGDYKDSEEWRKEVVYVKACAQMNSKNYKDAYETFVLLDGYKDSVDLALKAKLSEIKYSQKMDEIKLGDWVEGNVIYNGKNEDTWYVVEKTGDKVLLLSSQSFNFGNSNIIGGWGNSSIRSFLNTEYYDITFSDEIKNYIVSTQLQNSSNSNDITTDKIFILSKEEIEKYFPLESNRSGYISNTTLRNVEGNVYTAYCGDTFLEVKYEDGKFTLDEDSMGNYSKDSSNGGISFEYYTVKALYRDSFNRSFHPAMWIDVSDIE